MGASRNNRKSDFESMTGNGFPLLIYFEGLGFVEVKKNFQQIEQAFFIMTHCSTI
jgi:hypothetical protein